MEQLQNSEKLIPIWEKISKLLYENKGYDVLNNINNICNEKDIWDKNYDIEASNFIFRRDITEMSYSNTLKIIKESILKSDLESTYIGFRIISSKLEGYHRYTYFDRYQIFQLLDSKCEYDTENLKYIKYNPPGLSRILYIGEIHGNSRSIYKDSENKDLKYFNNKLNRAVKDNNIFYHVVEMDRYMGAKDYSKYHILHLCNLLNAYYSTEKYNWTKDLTKDYLNLYRLLESQSENDEFKDFAFQLVSTGLKTCINKNKINNKPPEKSEIIEIINFLEMTNELISDTRYLDYIGLFKKNI